MTDLKKKRYELVKDNMLKRSGIYRNGEIICGVWDLAFDLNNTWKARHFLSSNQKQNIRKEYILKDDFSIPDHLAREMFNGIKHGVRATDIEYIEQSGALTDYLVMKQC